MKYSTRHVPLRLSYLHITVSSTTKVGYARKRTQNIYNPANQIAALYTKQSNNALFWSRQDLVVCPNLKLILELITEPGIKY